MAPERLVPGGTVALTPDEWRYLARALRLVVGARLEIRDGVGGRYDGTLSPGRTLKIGDREELPAPAGIAVHLAFAPPKGRRLDWLLEKSAELGAHALWPVYTERTVRRDTAAAARWTRKLQAAARQCGAAHTPLLHPPRELSDLLGDLPPVDVLLAADPGATAGIAAALAGRTPSSALVLTGPEGGLSDDERQTLRTAGFAPFALGDAILRAETAPLTALTILRHLFGDL